MLVYSAYTNSVFHIEGNAPGWDQAVRQFSRDHTGVCPNPAVLKLFTKIKMIG
jgi:hypothetical protein